MLYVILTLLGVGFALYALSFFMNDRIADLEEQVEQISMNNMQENYQLKKKLKVLEEELLVDEGKNSTSYPKHSYREKTSQPPLVQKILDLYNKGYTTKQISSETSLHEHDILTTLRQYTNKKEVSS
ncbi:hypothetical protein N781_05655 [Pontibacillus halophilus JSM 076056 = DSM 19796]|uniref:Resolvase HTH domain-containing protein n=1 Tax=Pontibacillus halophilus JSM 076056 = DSM 19796 TaxID=1385510 RepID=A0A0A5I4U8_9BACI|nr:hypothetical protein [Pontibacillus halophilus]KGX90857.1 hypothetical protein N781_05655 [Pontibacillus halophilus JSM 076056 = DSM 19796]